MSIQTMQAVWQHSKSDGRARLVLLAIADHQGEIGAWPSIATLAKMVNSSERSVQRDIQYLQEIGELKVEVQNAPTNRQYKSNLYWVMLPGASSGVTAGVTETQSGVTDSASGVTAGGALTLIEPLIETNKLKAASEDDELFERFWNDYPRKADRTKTFHAFKKALSRAKFEVIYEGMLAYRDDPKRKPDYTKFPVNWLTSDSWENAPSGTEVRLNTDARRAREKLASKKFLLEQQELEANSSPPPKCEHGNTVALCLMCLAR